MIKQLKQIFSRQSLDFPDTIIKLWRTEGPFTFDSQNLKPDPIHPISELAHKRGDWTYQGQVSSDGLNPTGLGRLFHRRNRQVDEGQFQVRGKAIFLHGFGRKIWEDKLYEGYFVNGNLHGRGKMV